MPVLKYWDGAQWVAVTVASMDALRLDSGAEPAGRVVEADGSGGVVWGTTTQFAQHAGQNYSGNHDFSNAKLIIEDYRERSIGDWSTSASLDVDDIKVHKVLLDANKTLTFNFTAGATNEVLSFVLLVKQDATGGRTITWPTVRWSGAGTVPELTGTANSIDIFTFLYDDFENVWYGFTGGLEFA